MKGMSLASDPELSSVLSLIPYFFLFYVGTFIRFSFSLKIYTSIPNFVSSCFVSLMLDDTPGQNLPGNASKWCLFTGKTYITLVARKSGLWKTRQDGL